MKHKSIFEKEAIIHPILSYHLCWSGKELLLWELSKLNAFLVTSTYGFYNIILFTISMQFYSRLIFDVNMNPHTKIIVNRFLTFENTCKISIFWDTLCKSLTGILIT
jgi:hypothetical protein